MPYHADAVGMSWDQVPQGFQFMITSLMKSLGGAWLSTFVAIWAILFMPFRKGELWAKYMLPVISLACLIPALYGSLYVRANSTAEPPWMVAIVAIAIYIIRLLKKNVI